MWRGLRVQVAARILLLVCAAIAASLAPRSGVAQPSGARPTAPGSPERAAAVKKARAHFDTGQRLFTVSRYREALEEFKEGFLTVEDPVFLYNIAQCHRLLGESTDAIVFYRRFVEAVPSSPERTRAEKWIEELEQAAPSSGAPSFPAPAPSLPSQTPPPPSPGAQAGLEPAPITGDPAPSVSFSNPSPAPEADRPLYKRWWFWAGTAAAAILVAGTVSAAAKNRPLTCGGPDITRCVQL